ncbi:MAG TPA: acetyl-CoA carboxylase biotin carboxyl carrier protein [Thermoanaerobaculia bacterium]|nr:acetyl-CoA carboxylase biotin carboxyl carrier protein [Thermoanaerobaculia bacterium]
MNLNFKEILELIDKVADRGIGTVEIEQAGLKLRIDGKSAPQPQVIHSYAGSQPAPHMAPAPPPPPAPPTAAEKAATVKAEEDAAEAGLHIITSPIVGTFYRSANPESEPFCNVGDRVAKGQVLCIIEAMKLMNEIESDVDGVVTRIYPQNGQPIEYGEKLFSVKLS